MIRFSFINPCIICIYNLLEISIFTMQYGKDGDLGMTYRSKKEETEGLHF